MRIIKVLGGKKGELKVCDDVGHTVLRKGGTVAWRTNNPGNLKNGSFSRMMGSIGQDHIGHAVFPTVEHGIQAQYVLLFREDGAYYNLTLRDALRRYAPTGDNNDPDKYQRYITSKTGIPHDQKLKTLTHEKRLELMKHMQTYEGYKKGKDTLIKTYSKKKALEKDLKEQENWKDDIY
jgi:hypothetical protein